MSSYVGAPGWVRGIGAQDSRDIGGYARVLVYKGDGRHKVLEGSCKTVREHAREGRSMVPLVIRKKTLNASERTGGAGEQRGITIDTKN